MPPLDSLEERKKKQALTVSSFSFIAAAFACSHDFNSRLAVSSHYINNLNGFPLPRCFVKLLHVFRELSEM